MENLRIFKLIIVLVLIGLVKIECTPFLHQHRDTRPIGNETPEIDLKKDQEIEHYDQRQNGTENYRLKVDGLVFILAPADTLLMGAALEPDYTSIFADKPKPKPDKEDLLKPKPDYKPKYSELSDTINAKQKPSLRISHLLAPFLNKFRHAQQHHQKETFFDEDEDKKYKI